MKLLEAVCAVNRILRALSRCGVFTSLWIGTLCRVSPPLELQEPFITDKSFLYVFKSIWITAFLVFFTFWFNLAQHQLKRKSPQRPAIYMKPYMFLHRYFEYINAKMLNQWFQAKGHLSEIKPARMTVIIITILLTLSSHHHHHHHHRLHHHFSCQGTPQQYCSRAVCLLSNQTSDLLSQTLSGLLGINADSSTGSGVDKPAWSGSYRGWSYIKGLWCD